MYWLELSTLLGIHASVNYYPNIAVESVHLIYINLGICSYGAIAI
jgi:hypothetical protein